MTPPHVGFAAIPAPDFTRAAQNNLNIGRSNDVGRIRDYTLGDRTNQDMYGCDGEDRYDNASGQAQRLTPTAHQQTTSGATMAPKRRLTLVLKPAKRSRPLWKTGALTPPDLPDTLEDGELWSPPSYLSPWPSESDLWSEEEQEAEVPAPRPKPLGVDLGCFGGCRADSLPQLLDGDGGPLTLPCRSCAGGSAFNNATFGDLSPVTQVYFYKRTTRDGILKVEVRESRGS